MSEILTVVHECSNFNRWKAVYDADIGNRKTTGLTDLMLVRQADNPNMIALVFDVADHAKAKAMVTSPVLREVMETAGIIGTPDVHFRRGEFTLRDAANYLSVNCRIRDIDTFRKGYAMDKAERQNATLTDLGLLQNVDDANDLLLLWSVNDTAKAKSFLESPKLAEHQVKNAGLVGEPLARFWTK
jgi:hypothetical protein